jgi:glucose/arabinose dehydrogenase
MTSSRSLGPALAPLFLSVLAVPAAAPTDECAGAVIETVVGTGAAGYSGDGGPATAAALRWPSAIAVGPDGSLYIADTGNGRVRKAGADGTISTFAGGGKPADGLGDGGAATAASLNQPVGVAAGPDGSVYIADSGNHRIRVVDVAGLITTVVGDGEGRYSGDGGPATDASLRLPTDIALGPDGSVYVADSGNHRVRKVAPTGLITTIAGHGGPANLPLGDGGPAIEARVEPRCLAVGADGSIFIAEGATGRIRRVDPTGIIAAFAGDGWPDCINCLGRFAGDNGPATGASLNAPGGLAVGADGSLFIADAGNARVRRVDSPGVITTVAGSGEGGGVLGDGVPASDAGLGWPVDVAAAADGSLYIVDSGSHQVYRVWWRPCDPKVARAKADELRAEAGDSVRLWREAAELYLIAKAWDDALAAAERVLTLTPEADPPARLRAEVLIARVYAAKRDDHEARRRLIRILARAGDPAALREAADALVDLYLERGERDQAIATLSDLRLRTNDRRLLNWIDRRLKEIAGES